MKVNFMLIGAQKCGTTTLYSILKQHPKLETCTPKEPQFFCSTKCWKKELELYEGKFPPPSDKLYFESSTTYTFLPQRNIGIWENLYEYNPKLRFIYIVRDPIAAVTSRYMHYYQRGLVDGNIDEEIVNNRLFIDFSRYYTQIFPYVKRFGVGNVLLIDFADLVSRREKIIDQLSHFLEVEKSGFGDTQSIHSNYSVGGQKPNEKIDNPKFPKSLIKKFLPAYWNKITAHERRHFDKKPEMSSDSRILIQNMLRGEVRLLEDLFSRKFTHWDI